MGIRLIRDLSVDPSVVVLPRRVELTTKVRSTRHNGERATWNYSLDENHDVWFESQGWLVKEIEREEHVPLRTSEFVHRAVMWWGEDRNAEELDVPIALVLAPVAETSEPPSFSVTTLFVRLEQ